MIHDLRYALRTLLRAPGFTIVAVLSLALGIGANTAIFSVLDQVMLRTLPVREAPRFVALHSELAREGSAQSDTGMAVYSHPLYRHMRDNNTMFDGLIARAAASVTIVTGDRAERLMAETVSGNFFEVLGVGAAQGRLFTPADDVTPGGHPVVVLSHGYWTSAFSASRAVVGQTIRVNGYPMTVIGVAGPEFRGLVTGQSPSLYVPLAMKSQAAPVAGSNGDPLTDWRHHWLNLLGRLKPGIDAQRAQAAIASTFRAAGEQELLNIRNPTARYQQRVRADMLQLRPAAQGINQLRGNWEKPLVVVMGMVGLVLLLACANVANLLVARATARHREMALRSAIGANRWQLIRQLLCESLLLSVAGGAAGLVLARWVASGLLGLFPEGEFSGWVTADLNLQVLTAAMVLALVTGVLFGLLPALSGSKPESAATRRPIRLRRALVAVQVALSLLLLAGAGLYARTFYNLMRNQLGFQPDRLLVFNLNPQLSGYGRADALLVQERLRDRLAALPGVQDVSAAAMSPLGGAGMGVGITVEGYRAGADEDVSASMNPVAPGYFRTLGIPIKAGREIAPSDNTASAPKVAVVNQRFADHYFKGQNPLGRRIAFGRGDVKLDIEIIGVAADSVWDSLRRNQRQMMFLPYARLSDPRLVFLLRTAREDDAAIVSQVRAIVRETNAQMPVFGMRWMRERVADRAFISRLLATLASAFGVLALLLAAVGLYGVISYSVTRRTREFGIRIAIGATGGSVLVMVMREVAALVAAGLLVGVPLALAAGRLVETQLFGVNSRDPLVLGGGLALLMLVALGAGLLPARRAAAIHPMQALRHE